MPSPDRQWVLLHRRSKLLFPLTRHVEAHSQFQECQSDYPDLSNSFSHADNRLIDRRHQFISPKKHIGLDKCVVTAMPSLHANQVKAVCREKVKNLCKPRRPLIQRPDS